MEDSGRIYAAPYAEQAALLDSLRAPVLFQSVIERCVVTSHVISMPIARIGIRSITALPNFGYECVAPQGAFYLWMRRLNPMRRLFSEEAKSTNC